MKLFHGSWAPSNKHELKHFGTLASSLERVESMFLAKGLKYFEGGDTCIIYPSDKSSQREEPLLKSVEDFANEAKFYSATEYAITIENALRIQDLWEDNPIGSGGSKILTENTELTHEQHKEIMGIFHPFHEPIYQHHIYNHYTINEVKRIKSQYKNNPIFKAELKKRKNRSKVIGEDFSVALHHEVIWLDLTLKVRNWCFMNNFDALVYKNIKEANGEDSFITLTSHQVNNIENYFKFNKEKYLDIVMPVFKAFSINLHMKKKQENDNTIVHGMMWAGFEPKLFWDKV